MELVSTKNHYRSTRSTFFPATTERKIAQATAWAEKDIEHRNDFKTDHDQVFFE